MNTMQPDFKSKNWWLLVGWIPYFVLLWMNIDWRWTAVQREFNTLVNIFSGQYLYISVRPWGPEPHARVCCWIWTIITAFTAIYCGIIRWVSLWRKKKNYLAFVIPFGIVSLYVGYIWLWVFYVLISYIHQMGMTYNRGIGILCLITGLILWSAYSVLIGFPWEWCSKLKPAERSDTSKTMACPQQGGNSLKLLTLLLVMCCCLTCEATKVALVPTTPELAPLADQVLAAMATDPGVEFVERTEIAKILAERKLTAAGLTGENIVALDQTLSADLFAVITAKPTKTGAAASGLIVYSARSGFRLVNTNLLEADTVNAIVDRLRQAVNTFAHPDKQLWLSVAAVRDAGIPERFKYRAAYIAAELERRLGGIPGVMVLERDNLGSVNQERELTGQMFKLAPSARLVRLEFSPGETAATAELKLRLTNAAGHELFRWRKSDCFADEKTTMMQGLAALAGYLQTAMPELVSSEAEAARFYAEYQFLSRLGDYAAARRKLDSAIALNPKEYVYRVALIELISMRPYRYAAHELVENLLVTSRLADEINLDFPLEPTCYQTNFDLLEVLYNHLERVNSTELEVLSRWGDDYRERYGGEIKRRYYKFDFDNGINSKKELQLYLMYVRDLSRFYYYFNAAKWCDNLYRVGLKNLEVCRDFLQHHPELAADKGIGDGVTDWITELMLTAEHIHNNTKGRIDLKTPVETLVINSENYLRQAEKHPLLRVRLAARQLDLWRKTILNHYDQIAFKRDVMGYYRQCAALDPENSGKNAYWGARIAEITPEARSLNRLLPELKREFEHVNGKSSDMEKLFYQVEQCRTPEERARKVLELAPQLLEYRHLSFSNPKIRDFFYLSIGDTLFRSQSMSCKAALAAMNRDVAITFLYTLPKPSAGEQTVICNVVKVNNELYLLISRQQSERKYREIVRLDINTGKVQTIVSAAVGIDVVPDTRRLRPFAVVGNLALAGSDRNLLLFRLDCGSVNIIADLPGKNVMAATLYKDRIYAFTGAEEKVFRTEARETILFSCNLQGEDRKIHICTSREDKKNMFDCEKPFKVYNLIADTEKNRLLFTADQLKNGNLSGLWAFNPETNEGRSLLTNGGYLADPILTVDNNMLSISFSPWSHYLYNRESDQGEMIFSVTNPKARIYLKGQNDIGSRRGAIGYYGPFLLRPGQLWFGGNGEIKLLTLPDINRSPLILMPQERLYPSWSRLLFAHPDGCSIIAVDEHNIYRITPQ